MKPVFLYCYDAYCGWCYGFSPVLKQIETEYHDRLIFEVLSGGMILPARPKHIRLTATYIREAYKKVEERTGVKFGKEYLWHIFNPDQSDWYPHSGKPAIALCIFKEYYPDDQVQFASDLKYALHFEGRDLTDNEAYRHLLGKYKIPHEAFYEKLGSEEYAEKANDEFALMKKLKVTGFPTVFIQSDESRFHLVSRGYTDHESLNKTIGLVLNEIPSPYK